MLLPRGPCGPEGRGAGGWGAGIAPSEKMDEELGLPSMHGNQYG